jgi:hypothetical protein
MYGYEKKKRSFIEYLYEKYVITSLCACHEDHLPMRVIPKCALKEYTTGPNTNEHVRKQGWQKRVSSTRLVIVASYSWNVSCLRALKEIEGIVFMQNEKNELAVD